LMGTNAEPFRDLLAASNKEDRRVLPALPLPDILRGEPDETYDDEGKLSTCFEGRDSETYLATDFHILNVSAFDAVNLRLPTEEHQEKRTCLCRVM
jgi:hypothetical protein